MSGAVGSSMVGGFFQKLPGEKKVSIRKYLDIHLICVHDAKNKKLTEIVCDAGRNADLAESIKCHLQMLHGS